MKDNARFYWNGSRFVPSGTTVLGKPDLSMWAANCAVDYTLDNSIWLKAEIVDGKPTGWLKVNTNAMTKARTAYERESKLAAGFGTFIHWMCEQVLLKDKWITIPKKWVVNDDKHWELEVDVDLTREFMHGLWKWKEKHNVKVIATEHEVVTDTYGGRLDLVCEMDGVVTLVDFKTGKSSYYPNWKYQLAGYRQAWNRNACDLWDEHCSIHGRLENCKQECRRKIQSHAILKFNKKTGKVNYKCFDEYQATRTIAEGPRKPDGKLPTEKYTRNYETDRKLFNALVAKWWLENRGIEI